MAQIREAFCRAVDLLPGERGAMLAELPADLREEVESLLTAHESAGRFLDPRGERPLDRGECIGPYRILELIGQGGMGLVYRACRHDGEFQREAAIKLVGGRLFAPEAERRFISERRILALLDHPNIVRMIDGGVWEGQRYLVMELVSGEPISEYCASVNLSTMERLRLFQDVCSAIHYAHQRLVIHRDLKPLNILVTAERQAKVLDFGIARLLDEGGPEDASTTLLNPFTLSCASPEQVRGEPLTLSTDIYSLGLILYELLSGRNPQTGGTRREIEQRILAEDPVPPGRVVGGISSDLDAIVLKALAKDPARRYASVERLSADVSRYLSGLPVAARAPTWVYRARKFVVRRAAPLAAAMAIVAAVGVGVVLALSQSHRAERRFRELRSLAHSFLFEVYDSIGTSPGSLPARRLVAQRAQQYLDSLARDAGADSSLTGELAEAYLRLGDVQGRPYVPNLGDTAGALESYRKAVALLEPESLRHPNDATLLERLTNAYMNVAVIRMRRKEADECMANARRAIAAAEKLTANFPQNADYTLKLSHAYLRLGQGQAIASKQRGSIEAYQEELAIYRKSLAILGAAGPHPDESWQGRLRTAYFYIGYALRDLAAYTGDVSYFREALDSALKGGAINRMLVAANPNQTNRRDLADGLADTAVIRWKCCRDLEGALRDDREALAGFEGIAAEDPRNLEARRDVANVEKDMGTILGEAGRSVEAIQFLRKSLVMYQEVRRADPNSREDAEYIATVSARIGAMEQGKQ